MRNLLQHARSPQELAARRQLIEIKENILSFERLAAAIAADLESLDGRLYPQGWRDATVSGELRFDFAAARGNVPLLQGWLAVTVAAVCQRCLQAFELPLQLELRLVISAAGAAVLAPGAADDFEVWELQEELLRPVDLVDEVLVMALPFAAMHDGNTECAGMQVVADAAIPEAGHMTTPFADLKTQMARKKQIQ